MILGFLRWKVTKVTSPKTHPSPAVASRRTVCFLVSWHHWETNAGWQTMGVPTYINKKNHEGYQPSTTRYENLWNIFKHASFEICWNQLRALWYSMWSTGNWWLGGMGFLPECFKRSIWCSIRLQYVACPKALWVICQTPTSSITKMAYGGQWEAKQIPSGELT